MGATNANAPGQGGVRGTYDSSGSQFSYPHPSSVKGRVLGALLRGGESLTHLDCWRRFGSSRLSHHVFMLRNAGWPVEMVEKTVATSDGGRTASIGEYFLPADIIAASGERGQRYAAECERINAERRRAA